MKKLIPLLMAVVLFAACKKENTESKTPEEKKQEQTNQTIASLQGKWVRENFAVHGYKNGQVVRQNITDAELLVEVEKNVPPFVEFTDKRLIFFATPGGEGKSQGYTVNVEKSTITVTDDSQGSPTPDDITEVKYKFSNNNKSLQMTLDMEEDMDIFDELRIEINLKKVTSFVP